MVWEQVQAVLTPSPREYLMFDDVVLDKQHSYVIELARRQYSGKEKVVIPGIGIVTCVYVNPDTDIPPPPSKLSGTEDKTLPTCVDALAEVRRALWKVPIFQRSVPERQMVQVPLDFINCLADALCYAA